jgi:hypothetical protein
MTFVLIVNTILAALALAGILALEAWGIRGSRHEGRPLIIASRRRWVRPTISLRPENRGAAGPARAARPFAL